MFLQEVRQQAIVRQPIEVDVEVAAPGGAGVPAADYHLQVVPLLQMPVIFSEPAEHIVVAFVSAGLRPRFTR